MRLTSLMFWRRLALAVASCLLTVAPGAQAAGGPPGVGWIEIAHFDGTVPVTGTTYLVGTGSFAAANYAAQAGSYVGLGSQFTLAVVMGSVIDYYRPTAAASNLAAMLTSSTRHSWSASAAGSFVLPAYSVQQLGGSASGWPQDGRLYLSFWGTTTGQPGGCCQTAPGSSASWGQAFSLHLLPTSPVPEPSGWLLMGAGVLGLYACRRLAGGRVPADTQSPRRGTAPGRG